MKYLFLVFAFIAFYSCGKTGSTQSDIPSTCDLSGKYLNRTLLDKCALPQFGGLPYYALELNFTSSDTVIISNGVEKFSVPYEKTADKCMYKIIGATQFGDMHFSVFGDTVVQLADTAWTKEATNSTFEKSMQSSKKDWSFENFYNECIIAGTYTHTTKEGRTVPVYFLTNGQVSGLSPFLSYSLCYAGDCMEETEQPSQIIEFFTDKGTKELYVLKLPNGKSLVQFYNISDPVPDIKGGRKIEDLAFEIREGAQPE